ncbi:hypothetical protein P4278_31730 [Bacillus thuringiensis]|nr:hypothetical protein [Bacillus thuringiensis]MED2784167.1 hypothetical protein [Bacillus thuringiensis]
MNHLFNYSLNQKIPIELIYMKDSKDFSQRAVIVRKVHVEMQGITPPNRPLRKGLYYEGRREKAEKHLFF